MRALTASARFLGLVSAGLFAGFLLAVLVLELSLRDFGGPVYTQVRQVELIGLDGLATATLVPAMLASLSLLAASLRSRGRDFWLTASALAAMVAVFVVSLTVNVPINTEQLDWSASSPPPDWAGVRDRWQTAHLARTVLGVLAFGLAAVSAMTAKKPQPGS